MISSLACPLYKRIHNFHVHGAVEILNLAYWISCFVGHHYNGCTCINVPTMKMHGLHISIHKIISFLAGYCFSITHPERSWECCQFWTFSYIIDHHSVLSLLQAPTLYSSKMIFGRKKNHENRDHFLCRPQSFLRVRSHIRVGCHVNITVWHLIIINIDHNSSYNSSTRNPLYVGLIMLVQKSWYKFSLVSWM